MGDRPKDKAFDFGLINDQRTGHTSDAGKQSDAESEHHMDVEGDFAKREEVRPAPEQNGPIFRDRCRQRSS